MTTKKVTETPDAEQTEKMNKAAKVFLERAQEYDEMIEEAGAEYRIGMRHLANMMGANPETFTQQDANVKLTLNLRIHCAINLFLFNDFNENYRLPSSICFHLEFSIRKHDHL